MSDKDIALTGKELKELVAAAVAAAITESKKPTELEQLEIEEKQQRMAQQRFQLQQDNQTRRETAQQQIEIIEQHKVAQKICNHKHRRGDTHCVFINDELGGYVLCQLCTAIIRAGAAPDEYKGTVIYDTSLFNRLIQDTGQNSAMWE